MRSFQYFAFDVQVEGHVGDSKKPTGDRGFVRSSYHPKALIIDLLDKGLQPTKRSQEDLSIGPTQESHAAKGHVECSTNRGHFQKPIPLK